MDRRELLKTLSGGVAGIPAVQSIERIDVKPEDTIVFHYKDQLSDEHTKRVKEFLDRAFPGQKTLLVSGDWEIKVLRKAQ